MKWINMQANNPTFIEKTPARSLKYKMKGFFDENDLKNDISTLAKNAIDMICQIRTN